MTSKPVLLFVSPRFLFPTDSGGKIRTTQVLRGLKGGAFHVRLLMPREPEHDGNFDAELASVCDELMLWEPGAAPGFKKIAWLFRDLPVSVMVDRNTLAQRAVAAELGRNVDLAVFDFPHSAVLAPERLQPASVMFTHNIEAEIFKRHWQVAENPLRRRVWHGQYRKMLRYEQRVLESFDTTIAVSDRDCEFFRDEYGVRHCEAIPTGVDTDFFDFRPPADAKQVVFCGSMDWMANVDGIEYFHREIWPLVRAAEPGARMKVVGKKPADSLINRIRATSPEWEFTGFVDDVRDHVAGSAAFVIPLRVGGGTRIKAFEAMAMGCPVVSTSIGIEGLPVRHAEHFLCADDEQGFADNIVALIRDDGMRLSMAESARELVVEEFGFRKAAAVFEDICLRTLSRRQEVA